MKKPFRHPFRAVFAGLAALALGSCAYDPYYTSTSVGGSYSSGYGYNHGYGGSTFSTSYFVSTGSSRWGYDPYCNAYYDYQRRAYYDPYLYGYYPVGYRPVRVIGAPHPYGWRPGTTVIRPPTRVTNVTINNYTQREVNYRSRVNEPWVRNVRADRGRNYNADPNVRPQRPDRQQPAAGRPGQGGGGSWRGDQATPPRGGQAQPPTRGGERPLRGQSVEPRRGGPQAGPYNTPVEIRPNAGVAPDRARPQQSVVGRPQVQSQAPAVRPQPAAQPSRPAPQARPQPSQRGAPQSRPTPPQRETQQARPARETRGASPAPPARGSSQADGRRGR